MTIFFNKKIFYIFLFIFISKVSSLFAMEIESTNDLSQSIINLEIDSEKMANGFIYYLSQKFNCDKIDLDAGIKSQLRLLSDNPKISTVLCFHSYLYFRKYIKREPKVIEDIHKPSDLLYLVLLMIYIRHQYIYDEPINFKKLMQDCRLDVVLFKTNLLKIISTLSYRLSIEFLEQKMHNPPNIDPNPCGEFITDRYNPYGNIPAYYNQLLEWGEIQ